MAAKSAGEPRATAGRPAYAYVLRALREARGVTQEGWAAVLNYSVATVRRWETGGAVPPAEAEAALVAHCQQHGLFRTYDVGPLRGLSLTAELLRSMLAEARLSATGRAPMQPRAVPSDPATAVPGAAAPPSVMSQLPLVLSSFVGRSGELRSVRHLVSTTRLVTLTGPGGVGKTRLSLEIANALADEFANDVHWIDLAPVVDPDLLQPTIAQALDIRGAEQPLAALRGALHNRRLLLILDNFEQVLAGAPRVLELLVACPRMHVLITSRAALHVRGEQVFPVPPLSLPDATLHVDAGSLAQSEAVSLFVKRAQEVRPSFALGAANAADVADICQRLDGLPLALELAAARLQMLTPEALLGRLDRHLTLLVGGALDLPPRQQTLRATLDWSYELLDDEERRLLRRMAVFAGGCALDAVESVCHATDGEVVDVLARLVSQSLVVLDEADQEPRYRLLETVRQYAYEKLEQSDESDVTRMAHLDWCIDLVEQAEPRLAGAEQGTWMARLEREQENVRAALRWAIEHALSERGQRLGAAFWQFWWTRAYFPEGQRWLEELLALEAPTDARVRAKLLEGAGWMADVLGDLSLAEQRFEAALALRRADGDPRAIANTLGWWSFVAAAAGDLARAIALAEEGTAVARQQGDQRTIAQALTRLGTHLTMDGAADRGVPLLEEGAERARAAGDLFTVAAALDSLGMAERQRGNFDRSISVLNEDLRLVDEIGYSVTAAEVRHQLADTLCCVGHTDEARRLCVESLRLAHAVGDARRIANALRVAAAVENTQARYGQAVILCSAAEAVLTSKGIRFMPVEREALDDCLATAERELAAPAFSLARGMGERLDVDGSVRWALQAFTAGASDDVSPAV